MRGTHWEDWRNTTNAATWPRKNSPNLQTIYADVLKARGWQNLGGYVDRPIRGGSTISIHRFGAFDWRHDDAAERVKVIQWLIDNSQELHVGEIHDYAGVHPDLPKGHGGYWKANRAEGDGWRPAKVPSGDPNMSTPGKPRGALWVHVETTNAGWGDTTPIAKRGIVLPDQKSAPKPQPDLWKLAVVVPREERPWIGHPDCQADTVEVAGIQVQHWRSYFREVAASLAGQTIDFAEPWNMKDIAALRNLGGIAGVPGAAEMLEVNPQIWAVVDYLAAANA